MDNATIKNYILLLELPLNKAITLDDIKRAYRRLSKKYHPDTAGVEYKDGKKFTELTKAKDFLTENIDYVNRIISNGQINSKKSTFNLFEDSYEDVETSWYEAYYWEQVRREAQERARKEEEARRKAEEIRRRRAEEERKKREAEEKRRKEEYERKQREEAERKLQYNLKKNSILNDIKAFHSSLKKDDYFGNDYAKINEDIMTFTRNVNNNVYSSIQELTNAYNNVINKIKAIKTISQVKTQKRRRNTIISCLSAIAAVVVFVILLFEIILPTINYNKAVDLLEQNKYEEAGEIFEELDDFKDSNEQVVIIDNELKYQNAVNLLNNNQLTEAKQIFVELNGYRDSNSQIAYINLQIKYLEAIELLNNYEFTNAKQLFNELGDFKDSADRVDYINTQIKYEPVYNSLKEDNYYQAIEQCDLIGVNIKYNYDYNGTNNANELEGYDRIPEKKGYTFIEWETLGYELDSKSNTLLLNLKASYQVDIFTISYIGAKGEYTYAPPYSYTINDSITLPSPLHAGYEFLGWFENDEKVDCIEAGTIGNRIFTAKYQANRFNITYDANDGSPATTQVVTYGEEMVLKVPYRKGYSFKGWKYGNSNFEKTQCDFAYDITLIGEWLINTYTLTFNSNGGSAVDSQKIEYLKVGTKPQEPYKAGYLFKGWYLADSPYDFSSPIECDNTIIAKWEIIMYNIKYNLYSATNALENKPTYTIEDEIEFLAPTKKGYTFEGWFLENTFENKIEMIPKGRIGSLELYACFMPKKFKIEVEPVGYNVEFNLNYEENAIFASQNVTVENSIEYPEIPIRERYCFTGWYLDKECTNLFDFTSTINKDLTLYAGWYYVPSFEIINGYNYSGKITNTNNWSTYKKYTFSCLSDCRVTISITNPTYVPRYFKFTNLTYDIVFYEGTIDCYNSTMLIHFNVWAGNIIEIYTSSSREPQGTSWSISNLTLPKCTAIAVDNSQKVFVEYDDSFKLDIREREGYKFVGYFDEKNVQITDSEGNGLTPYNFDEDIILHEVWQLDEQ